MPGRSVGRGQSCVCRLPEEPIDRTFSSIELRDAGAEVRESTYPIFEEDRRKSGAALLERIKDEPAHGAVGVHAVMERLIEGRMQKLMLGRPVDGAVSEYDNCGRL
jgi:hypothetical protein